MVTYRQAVMDDTPVLVGLLREIMLHHGVDAPQDGSLHDIVRTAFDSPFHSFVVAEDADVVIGMCALVFSYSTWSAALVCELQDVVVSETSRRNKVGEGLIRAAEVAARERGCARLHLLAEYWNLDAHAFYRSLGLTEKTCLYFERDLRGPLP